MGFELNCDNKIFCCLLILLFSVEGKMEDKFIMSKTADRETFVVSLIVWRQKENKCSSKNENIKTQKLSELLSLH